MRCLDSEALTEVVDGVADDAARAHVASCARCADAVARIEALGAGLRALPLAQERATATLRATLRGLEAGARAGRRRWIPIPGFAAAMAAAAVLFLAPGGAGMSAALADEASTRHLRAFARNAVCEVESRDPAELERWFERTFGEAIDVPHRPGFELVGARRCSLFGEEAGAVVYRSGEAAVTMFVPRPGSRAARACAQAVGACRLSSAGQTVCAVDTPAGPRLLVGELPAERLCEVAQGRRSSRGTDPAQAVSP